MVEAAATDSNLSGILSQIPKQAADEGNRLTSGGRAEASSAAPGCYLIVHNVSKRHNVGMIIRSATAFGVTEVCLAECFYTMPDLSQRSTLTHCRRGIGLCKIHVCHACCPP